MESTNHVVGVDEAGAGPAFGSLWAAAVCLDGAVVDGLRDSKKLSEKKRKALRETIVATCSFGLGEVTHAEIDALGMGECRRLVFERALDDYALRRGVEPSRIIVDGHLFRQWRTAVHECHDKADDKFPEVSAASVLAKTSRDAQVLAWCDEDPTLDERYGLRANKGYLAPRHLQGLAQFGFSERHRRSFRVKALQVPHGEP